MKKLFIILLTLITLTTQAQNWKKGLAVVGYHTATIALGAAADGLYDEGNKEWSHALHAIEVGALISGPFIFKLRKTDFISYILSYTFLRFTFFDSFYNITRDLPLLYNGSTSTYDEVMNKMPDHGKAWYKSCSLVIGIALPIKELR